MTSTKKFFNTFGRKNSSKRKTLPPSSAQYALSGEDDPVKIMQERMLHKALHNGNAALTQTAIPPPSMRSRSKERIDPHRRVLPPRGTLCDDKLPYLDWRLSMLSMEQARVDEKERQEYIYQQEQINIHTQQSRQRAMAAANQIRVVDTQIEKNISKRWSSITSASTSASTSGSDMSSRKHSDSVDRHQAPLYDHHHTIDSLQGWQRSDIPVRDTDSNDLEAKAALQRALATRDELADVPRLSKGEHFTMARSGESEGSSELAEADEEEEEGSMSSARGSASVDEFYDAEERLSHFDYELDHTMAVSSDSYFIKRPLGFQNNAKKAANNAQLGRITNLFPRTNIS